MEMLRNCSYQKRQLSCIFMSPFYCKKYTMEMLRNCSYKKRQLSCIFMTLLYYKKLHKEQTLKCTESYYIFFN